MESILSMHDDIYSFKSRHNRSSSYLANTMHIRRNTLNNKSNTFSLVYQSIKRMIAQRTLYILGILNLILAGIAIVCVAQAEDHPEYFSLVYISISIFIFYMSIIVFIIIAQIIETYQEQHQKNRSSLTVQMPLLTTQSKAILVESMTTKTQPKTSLSRSQTLPLTSNLINPYQTLSTSTHFEFSSKNPQLILNLPKNYQSFAFTTNDRFYPTITNSDSTPHLSSIIKPIPFKYPVNNTSKI